MFRHCTFCSWIERVVLLNALTGPGFPSSLDQREVPQQELRLRPARRSAAVVDPARKPWVRPSWELVHRSEERGPDLLRLLCRRCWNHTSIRNSTVPCTQSVWMARTTLDLPELARQFAVKNTVSSFAHRIHSSARLRLATVCERTSNRCSHRSHSDNRNQSYSCANFRHTIHGCRRSSLRSRIVQPDHRCRLETTEPSGVCRVADSDTRHHNCCRQDCNQLRTCRLDEMSEADNDCSADIPSDLQAPDSTRADSAES